MGPELFQSKPIQGKSIGVIVNMQTQREVQGAKDRNAIRPVTSEVASFRDMAGSLDGSPSLGALQQALTREQARSQAGTQASQWLPETDHPSVSNPAKRFIDLLGACLILLSLLPLLALCGVLLKISSPGPIFYRQRRLGLGGHFFSMWKFRTMCVDSERVLEKHLAENPDAELEWIQTHKLTNDPRVTSIGRTMRTLSIDELPQLWNVVTGSMSLVGPRPIVATEIEKYGQFIEAYYSVRPGMTGLWQVSGRSNTTYPERVALDQRYVANWSLPLDGIVFLKTFKVLLKSEGAY